MLRKAVSIHAYKQAARNRLRQHWYTEHSADQTDSSGNFAPNLSNMRQHKAARQKSEGQRTSLHFSSLAVDYSGNHLWNRLWRICVGLPRLRR